VTDQSNQLVEEHWGSYRPAVERVFYGFPPLRPHLYEYVAGRPPDTALGRDWVERWIVAEHLADRTPFAECVSLCCGFGEVEQLLAGLGIFEHCVGIDLAEQAVATARHEADEAGLGEVLDFRAGDLNALELDPESVDLVWSNGALHHLSELEHVVAQAHRALRPGGTLVAVEYTGPNLNLPSARHRELINAAVHVIPPRLRSTSEATFIPSKFKAPGKRQQAYRAVRKALRPLRRSEFRFGKVWDSDPWYTTKVDPSEGVRAEEIVRVLRDTFDEIQVNGFGGSLLQWALDPTFYERFDESSVADARVLRTLVELEHGLIESGELEHANSIIIARKRAAVGEPAESR
jgi:SAM-dependent methyltransferase